MSEDPNGGTWLHGYKKLQPENNSNMELLFHNDRKSSSEGKKLREEALARLLAINSPESP